MFQKTLQSNLFLSVVVFIAAALAACSGGAAASPTITDITWQWASVNETEPAAQSVVPNPENYTLTLNADGTHSLKVDCNMAGGAYTLDGDQLTLGPGPMTLAFCGEESLDMQFLAFLAMVESYSVEDGQLVLSFQDGAGEMRFNEG